MATIREITEGLKILAKYLPEGEEAVVGGAEHDIFYVCPVDAVDLPKAEVQKLKDLGWHKDHEAGWAIFV